MADADARLIAEAASKPAAEALTMLLEVWRRRPDPALAGLIEIVGARVEGPTVKARTNKQTAARFLEVAATPDDGALGALLEVFPVGTMKAGFAQMIALSHWPADPRLSATLLGLFDDAPYRSRPALEFWHSLIATVERIGDPRSAAVVTDLIGRTDQCFAQPMSELLRRALTAARVPARPAAASNPEIAAAVAAVEASFRAPVSSVAEVPEALLAAVYAEPDNAELRLIYADACAGAGDPRGEVIMIGHLRESGKRLTKEQRQREKALLDEHLSGWLGDLGRVLLKSSIKLRLGFLDAGAIKPKHDAHVRPLIGDERWSTVRDLEIHAVADYHNESAAAARGSVEELVKHPVMRGLRRLTGDLSRELVIELCEGARDRQLETIFATMWGDDGHEAIRAALATAPRLPRLEELIIRHAGCFEPGGFRWLLEGEVMARLQSLELRIGMRDLARWVPVFLGGALERLAICDSWAHSRVEFLRAGDRPSIRAYFRWPGMRSGADGAVSLFAATLDDIDPGSIETLEVAWTRSSTVTAGQRAALERAIDRLAPSKVKIPKH